MNKTADIVRKGRKFDQVIEGARKVFLANGFEGASVDDIARAAEVSKATLYSYFPDKRLLFIEVASSQCRLQADQAVKAIDFDTPAPVVLRQAGQQMMDFFFSDIGLRIFRIFVAEAHRFPELGQKYYSAGPMRGRILIAEYLNTAVARGELNIQDTSLAADQFIEMCKADLWPKMIFGINSSFSKEERDRVLNGAIETFLARYGV